MTPSPKKHIPRAAMLVALIAAASGCSTSRPQADAGVGPPSDAPSHAALSDSSIDISYVLGHSHRRFVAWGKKEVSGGQTLLDHQVLRESTIDHARYSDFLAKAEQFVNTPRRHPADQGAPDETCRTPFTVTLRIGSDTQIMQGCRGEDDGALSHLVRDGEFLLYSAK